MELQIKFVFFVLWMGLSSALEVKKNLIRTVGGNVTLPDAVLEEGILKVNITVIAEVVNATFEILDDHYRGRLHWGKTSGLITLTDLQKRDSGNYSVDPKKRKVFTTSYLLTVYDSVAPPNVSTLSVSSDSCSLLCAVDKAAEITLWWYKDQEMVNQSSSAGPLPLTVTKQDLSSSYRCVAGNPAENRTLLVDVKTTCGFNSSSDDNSRHGSEDSRADVEYTEVSECSDRQSQLLQGGNSPDPPGFIDRSNLTTVYDKLEAQRMLPESDGHV